MKYINTSVKDELNPLSQYLRNSNRRLANTKGLVNGNQLFAPYTDTGAGSSSGRGITSPSLLNYKPQLIGGATPTVSAPLTIMPTTPQTPKTEPIQKPTPNIEPIPTPRIEPIPTPKTEFIPTPKTEADVPEQKNSYDALLDYYKQQYDSELSQLESKYRANIESLDRSRANSQQAASITLDKLKKYLPTQIEAQGLGGLGVSESTMLQAYNNYNNQLGDIAKDYNAQKTALETHYGDSKFNIDSDYREGVMGVEQQKLSDQKEDATTLYNDLLTDISLGAGTGYNTTYQLEQRYKEIRSKLDNTQRSVIEGKIKTLKDNTLAQTTDSDYYHNAFYTDDGQMTQEQADAKMDEILKNQSFDDNEITRFKEALIDLYPDSFYAMDNYSGAYTRKQYNAAQYVRRVLPAVYDAMDISTITFTKPSNVGEYEELIDGNGNKYWAKPKTGYLR